MLTCLFTASLCGNDNQCCVPLQLHKYCLELGEGWLDGVHSLSFVLAPIPSNSHKRSKEPELGIQTSSTLTTSRQHACYVVGSSIVEASLAIKEHFHRSTAVQQQQQEQNQDFLGQGSQSPSLRKGNYLLLARTILLTEWIKGTITL